MEPNLRTLALLLYNNLVTAVYNTAQIKECKELCGQILKCLGAPIHEISNTPNPKDIIDNANDIVNDPNSDLRILGTLAYFANSITLHIYTLVTNQPDADIAAVSQELYDLINSLTILEKAQELVNASTIKTLESPAS